MHSGALERQAARASYKTYMFSFASDTRVVMCET